MITRQDYMKDPSNLHRSYYGQFVNDEVKNKVLEMFPLDRLLKSEDKHLNDLPLTKWDLLGGFIFSKTTGEMLQKPNDIRPIEYNLLKEANEGVSSSTMVCIYKEAARQIIESN